jgi:hypothetical protein
MRLALLDLLAVEGSATATRCAELLGERLQDVGDRLIQVAVELEDRLRERVDEPATRPADARPVQLLVGQSLSSFGDSALYLSLSIWAEDLTGSNAAAGLGVLALLAVQSRAQLWIIYAVAAGYGVAFALLSAAMSGLLKDLLRPGDLAGANASFQAVGQGLPAACSAG